MSFQDYIAEFIATRPDVAVGLFVSSLVAVAMVMPPVLHAIGRALAMVYSISFTGVAG